MARGGRGRRISTGLVLLGVVAILGGTFGVGFFSGRHWERVAVLTGLVKPGTETDRGRSGADPGRSGADRGRPGADRDRSGADRGRGGGERGASGGDREGASIPALTFYHELTAPMSPAPSRPARKEGGPGRADSARREPPKPDAAKPRVDEKPGAAGTTGATLPASRSPMYTVQVAAYGSRAPADALVERLASRGFAADVSETTTSSGARYRVRIGAYPTRDAARQAATRLAEEARLGGFVAAR